MFPPVRLEDFKARNFCETRKKIIAVDKAADKSFILVVTTESFERFSPFAKPFRSQIFRDVQPELRPKVL